MRFFGKVKNARKRSFFRPLGASLPARVSTSKEAMRKRIERRRNKLRAAMSDDFAAASRAISPDSDDDVKTERSAQVISADDDDDVVEREPHYVDNQGREMKRKPTRAALPAWGVVTAGGSRKWQPTERALVIEQHQKLNTTGAHDYARTAVVLHSLHPKMFGPGSPPAASRATARRSLKHLSAVRRTMASRGRVSPAREGAAASSAMARGARVPARDEARDP